MHSVKHLSIAQRCLVKPFRPSKISSSNCQYLKNPASASKSLPVPQKPCQTSKTLPVPKKPCQSLKNPACPSKNPAWPSITLPGPHQRPEECAKFDRELLRKFDEKIVKFITNFQTFNSCNNLKEYYNPCSLHNTHQVLEILYCTRTMNEIKKLLFAHIRTSY